jgi:hypothetical protein
MGLRVEHRLVLHRQEVIKAGVDRGEDQPFPVIIEGAPLDRDLAIAVELHQGVERMRPRVELLGDAAIEDTEHIAGVDQFPGPRHALGLDIGVVVNLRGFRGVTG